MTPRTPCRSSSPWNRVAPSSDYRKGLFVFSFFSLFAPTRSLRLVDAPNLLSVVPERLAFPGFSASPSASGNRSSGVNTAARILDACRALNRSALASRALVKRLGVLPDPVRGDAIAPLALRGKAEPLELVALERA